MHNVLPKLFEPNTTKVVVVNGEATVLAAFALLKLADGDQVYELAPLAVITVVLPEQMVSGLPTVVMVGVLITDTITVSVLIQPRGDEPVTEYNILLGVVEITVELKFVFKKVVGFHV